MSIIFSQNCPICDTKNFFDNGDEEDQTIPDIEAGECIDCGAVFFIEGVDWIDDIEDTNTKRGKRRIIVE